MKSGRLSKTEWEYIEQHGKKKTAEEIGRELDRDPISIMKYLRKVGLTLNSPSMYETQAEYDLKGKPFWRELKSQFTDKELELFVFHWKSVIAQFRKDVLPTEEMQIIDMIKLEVLMNRALTEQQDSMVQIRDLNSQIEVEEKKGIKEQDREHLHSLKRQVASLRAAKESLSKDYKELQKNKNDMFKELKATRAHRIQKIESDKITFVGLINKLMSDPEFFDKQGREMEMMRLAAQAEKARLSDYHTFVDGSVSRPLMTTESVVIGDEE